MVERLRDWWRYPFSPVGPVSLTMYATVVLTGALSAELIASQLGGFVLTFLVLFVCRELILLSRAWFIRRRSIVVPRGGRRSVRVQLVGIVVGALVAGISAYVVVGLDWKPAWIVVFFLAPAFAHEIYVRRRWTRAGKPGDPRGAIDWSPEKDPAHEFQAFALLASGRPLEARRLFGLALERKPTDKFVLYNLACAEALTGQTDEALEHLNAVVATDGRLRRSAQRDKDLASIRDDPRFPKP